MPDLPGLDGRLVVDANNYYPGRDGQIAEIDDGKSSSRWVADQHPGATVVKAQKTADQGIKVSFSTPDDAAKVTSYFSDNFAAQGWSSQRIDAPDGTLVVADKGARSPCGHWSHGGRRTMLTRM